MFTKILNWLKTSGAQMAVNSLPLAEPYLVEQIKKAEGKIGETPEEKAHFLISHLQDYMKAKLNLK